MGLFDFTFPCSSVGRSPGTRRLRAAVPESDPSGTGTQAFELPVFNSRLARSEKCSKSLFLVFFPRDSSPR